MFHLVNQRSLILFGIRRISCHISILTKLCMAMMERMLMRKHKLSKYYVGCKEKY